MPRPSCPLMYSNSAMGSCSMTEKNLSSCKPQSHLAERSTSPVKHSECMRTATSDWPCTSPLIAATTWIGNPPSSSSKYCNNMPFPKAELRTGMVHIDRASSIKVAVSVVEPHVVHLTKSKEPLMGEGPFSRTHLRNSSTEINGMEFFLLKAKHSSNRIISPSSRISSPMAATVLLPARRHKSYADSVCPPRSKTPPGRGHKGNMWPGFEKSSGVVSSKQKARTVSIRSAAETPVVVFGR
mmetsp:Transcript_57627/g.160577  ORF Transcript_57627/g.160577 Transcript_57627/m.160577 type:complete len:240 (+) Transcript_57627:866-1585(+)